jgi:hypothetical protein
MDDKKLHTSSTELSSLPDNNNDRSIEDVTEQVLAERKIQTERRETIVIIDDAGDDAAKEKKHLQPLVQQCKIDEAIWLRRNNLFEINSKSEEVAKKEELYNSVDSEKDSEDSEDYYNYRRNPFRCEHLSQSISMGTSTKFVDMLDI